MGADRNLRNWVLGVAVVAATASLAQTTAVSTTKQTTHRGTVVSTDGNALTVQERDGIHTYNVPPDFKFQMGDQRLSVNELTPGMKVTATTTEEELTEEQRSSRHISGTVLQVAPGGIVVKTATGDKSYNFKDPQGRDIVYIRDGKQVPLSTIVKGEKLEADITSVGVPLTSTTRITTATVTAPPPAPSATPPTAVAAAPRHHMPKTASPVPLLAVLAGLSAAVALGARRWRLGRGS